MSLQITLLPRRGTWGCCQITGAWWPLGTAQYCGLVATPGAVQRLLLLSSPLFWSLADVRRQAGFIQGSWRPYKYSFNGPGLSFWHFDWGGWLTSEKSGNPFPLSLRKSLEKAHGFISGFVLWFMLRQMGLSGCCNLLTVGCLGWEGRVLPPSFSRLAPALVEKIELGSGIIPNYHKLLHLFPSARDALSSFLGRAGICWC